MYNNIRQAIKSKNLILFVGSGVSATLKLPSWSMLIDHIAEELGFENKLFKQYGDNLTLAEYYFIKKGHIGELRSWMDKSFAIDRTKIENSEIYRSIVELDCPMIYTTNYDNCLEIALEIWGKKFRKIVSVDDLVNIPQDCVQVVKFHGDLTRDDSIVFAESKYFERLNFESHLDIKLRSDIIGKEILFLGYSLSDVNIRLLIYKLDELWRRSNSRLRPKSYIFLPTPNPIQELILSERGITPIVGDSLDKTESILEFLKNLK